MSHPTLNGYLGDVLKDVEDRDGYSLSRLISYKHPHVANPRLQVRNPDKYCEDILPQPWDEIIAAHIRAICAINDRQFEDAYKYQIISVQAFTKLLQSMKDDNWCLPVMFIVCTDVRLLANTAESMKSKSHQPFVKGEMLEKSAEAIMGCFRVCASDSRASVDVSKKWGMLTLVNQLLKIYFKINKLHLCKPLIRAIDSLPMKDKFSLSQLVTYRYYVGRKAVFENDFKMADEYLTFAFEHCHRASAANKRLILISLLPVKMLCGRLPSRSVLEKYNLLQFEKVVQSVRQGNLLGLNEALVAHEEFFIKTGVYLILEKLKIITYRNLFKKVWLLLGSNKLPVSSFLEVLKLMKVDDVDLNEAECIVANLIFEGKVKGYISHAHRTVVVSKADPFPKLTDILNPHA